MAANQLPAYFKPKTKPFEHQHEALARSYNKRNFALFMEQGTGKSKVVIDTSHLMYDRGHIDALVVIAPNEVHVQWIAEQVPVHMPDHIKTRCVAWGQSTRAKTQTRELVDRVVKGRLVVFTMNWEALSTKRGRDMLAAILKRYRCLLALDEIHNAKSPKASCTRAAWRLAPLAFARRILSGTPIVLNPHDLYGEYRCLDWRIIGFDSAVVFRARYGDYAMETFLQKSGPRAGQVETYPSLIGFKNLDELYSRVDAYTYKVLKADCLDLPPKMYQTVPVALSKTQRTLHDAAIDNGVLLFKRLEQGKKVELEDMTQLADEDVLERLIGPGRDRMTFAVKLVLALRLRQIVGGFVTGDDKTTVCTDGQFMKVPRAKAAVQYVETALATGHKVIVWANFRAELQALYPALRKELGVGCALMYGDTPKSQRSQIIDDFKDKKHKTRVLIAHPRTAGTGFNFTVARTCLYYSNGNRYADRAQSEDRVHRIGTTGTVTIADMCATGVPVDADMVESMLTKKDFGTKFYAYTAKEFIDHLRGGE